MYNMQSDSFLLSYGQDFLSPLPKGLLLHALYPVFPSLLSLITLLTVGWLICFENLIQSSCLLDHHPWDYSWARTILALLLLLFLLLRPSSASSGQGVSFRPFFSGDSGHTRVLTPNNSGKLMFSSFLYNEESGLHFA